MFDSDYEMYEEEDRINRDWKRRRDAALRRAEKDPAWDEDWMYGIEDDEDEETEADPVPDYIQICQDIAWDAIL